MELEVPVRLDFYGASIVGGHRLHEGQRERSTNLGFGGAHVRDVDREGHGASVPAGVASPNGFHNTLRRSSS